MDTGCTKDKLIERCNAAGISITKQVPNIIKDGWYGKAKGVFQILWERG